MVNVLSIPIGLMRVGATPPNGLLVCPPYHKHVQYRLCAPIIILWQWRVMFMWYIEKREVPTMYVFNSEL